MTRLFCFLIILSIQNVALSEDSEFGSFDDFNESFDEEFDFDFTFTPKSTIDTVSLESIDNPELSDAAIAGALKTSVEFSGEGTDKPAYERVAEREESQKKIEREETETRKGQDAEQNAFPETPSPFIEEQFVYDTGRTLEIKTTTVERP
ncbi:hypothetical protein A3715_02855 [Oleiphilus sp. HI0009]|uniref:hypothetical protein n=1 Tax=unclassified Oleiphilus TaxID=2631174 RepID=UPI0007C28F21|nr:MULTISPECIES: hypothetical protein [unclassified Oleiphilus]KZX73492.1 hypothetical protein A3715_02855 [Oleiphilus sp. HI0009]KZY62173.1 hypothetical protein A3738_21575 [Oleiphilus sp. HI0066]KZY64475.1 hypothetical protein A3738_01560 [Oleiphilus sp. HI0066]KZY70195.1 hypothetical protein A3739_18235 [Oleiphilus sp. HI0067]KZY71631.1 hypothetical protein A3739_04360 [Oleiphilus sp. HI0067]